MLKSCFFLVLIALTKAFNIDFNTYIEAALQSSGIIEENKTFTQNFYEQLYDMTFVAPTKSEEILWFVLFDC